jgi:hypothetical protein
MAVEYATETERELHNLLQKFAYRLSTTDLAEATEYLAAREYGLALEAIAEGLREPDGHIDPAVASHIAPLAEAMEIKDRPFLKAL